jgi:signal transduction histidine kinase
MFSLSRSSPSFHSAQRTFSALGTVTATAALFLAGLASPRISAAVGVTFDQGARVVAVFLSAVTLATLAYFRFGAASRLYRYLDFLETFVLSGCVAYLIQASSAVHSFFWIFHGAQVLMAAVAGYSLVYLLTVCVGPAYLVALFLWQGQTASAWLSALAGICGVMVYALIARLSSQRDAALRRAAVLRQELGRLWVARERARISRDLHDSVATEITALVWRVHEISDALPSGPYRLDILGVAERLRAVIGDLRNVVLSLREPELGFSELELALERRCRELCGHTALRLNVEGQVGAEELSVFQDQVLPICFELVNNAARHAGASQVELTLRIGDCLRLVVSDNGRPVSPHIWQESRGGLRGIRERAERMHGSVALEVTRAGKRFVVELPRPLGQRSSP